MDIFGSSNSGSDNISLSEWTQINETTNNSTGTCQRGMEGKTFADKHLA